MPAPPWRALERIVDDIVDDQWGEPVELYPWTEGGVEDEGGLDPSRSVVKTTGIFVTPGARAMGEGGTVGSGLATRLVSNDTWVSFSEHMLGTMLHAWKEGDRVYFPDRDQWFTVLYPTPSATARPQIYLARMQLGSPHP